MVQEPWNEEIFEEEVDELDTYETPTPTSRRRKNTPLIASGRLFTVLATIFIISILVMIIGALYLSIGGSDTSSAEGFYNGETVQQETTADSAAVASEENTQASEAASNSDLVDKGDGTTLTVQPGEGLGQIASRAGISIAELERLNPEKMTSGTWLAHPGDVVRIK